MGATLDALHTLQQIELKLNALRSKVGAKKRAVRVHQKRLAALDQQLAAQQERGTRQQSSLAQVELEVRSNEDEITRLREALNRSRTNKEYAAILTQINTTKADNSKLEDRVLEMMTELEGLKQETDKIRGQYEEEQRRLANATAAVEAFERESQAEFDDLQKQRDEAAAAVPSETLKIFERVAERHDGEALALVVQPHPKREEYICEGCNMTVTLEQYVALRGADQIQVCINCGRVLFIDE